MPRNWPTQAKRGLEWGTPFILGRGVGVQSQTYVTEITALLVMEFVSLSICAQIAFCIPAASLSARVGGVFCGRR